MGVSHRIAGWAAAAATLAGLIPGAEAAGVNGVIYDSRTGVAVRGATVSLVYDGEDPREPGVPVPAARLGPGQQGQKTGADGRYRFDLEAGRLYRLVVGVAGVAYAFPSARVPAAGGFAPSGAVTPSPSPPLERGDHTYYLRFNAAAADYQVQNNHVPIDRLDAVIDLDKRASTPLAEAGDTVTYRVEVKNSSDRDLTAAAGRAVFVRDAPPRGFSLIEDSAGARLFLGGAGQAVPVSLATPDTGRLLRFGPLDLPAGSRLVLAYRMVVGADIRPGKWTNHAVLVDSGGVELSSRAAATVEVERGRGFDASVILGRVFCDRDGDGHLDPGEPGLFGAHVYLDTGSYAVSDAGGLFHFSRVEPGVRLVKLDEASLGASQLRGEPRRQLRLSPGLPGKVSYPVACHLARVRGDDPRATRRPVGGARGGAAAKRRAVVSIDGELVLLEVSVGGRSLGLPSASAILVAPRRLRLDQSGGPNLAPPPPRGYGAPLPRFDLGWSAPAGVSAERWSFAIDEVDATGTRLAFYLRAGTGAPPTSIAWNGHGSDGRPAEADRLYVAQLTVTGEAGTEAASALVPFGVGYGQSPASRTESWTGALFAGSRDAPTATAELVRRVGELARELGSGGKVAIEAHDRGGDDPLALLAATQRRADLVARLLRERGVAASRIEARGRGDEDEDNSRRVVVRISGAPGAPREVPETFAAEASAKIGGAEVGVDSRGRFRWRGPLPQGGLPLELQAQDGRRAGVRVPAGAAVPAPPAPGPAGRVAAADFWLDLPPAGTELGIGELALRGRVRSGNRIAVNGVSLPVAPGGALSARVPLPPGATEVVIQSRDRAGNVVELHWPLSVADRQLFAMGLGELAAATSVTSRGLFGDTAYLPGMGPDNTWAVGPLLLSGRATFYLKGELKVGDLFDRLKITAGLDTSRRERPTAFFEDLDNPVRDMPVYGDSAVEVRDTPGRGKLYLRLEAGKSKLVVGALAAELGTGHLFSYGRTVDGVGGTLRKSIGDHHLKLDGFGTAATVETHRDHVWYRSTGGTVYYLRFANVVEGSELLRVEVRERDSGLVLDQRQLRRNIDYTIDYQGGRVWLIEPLPSSRASGWILENSDADLGPGGGNPIYIEARYEHRDPREPDDRSGGVEVSYRVAGLAAGAGVVGESREAAGDYTLWGARAHLQAARRSSLSAEIAGSRRSEGELDLSVDGGITFRDLGASTELEGASSGQKLAYRLGADLRSRDFLDRAPPTRLRLYLQDIDRDFSSSATGLERGRLKFGALIASRLGARDSLLFRHQGEIAELPRLGPGAADVPADPTLLDERAAYVTSLAWRAERGAFVHRLEAAHQRLSSTAPLGDEPALDAERVGLGGRTTWAASEHVALFASQQAWLATRDADPLLDPLAPGTRRRDADALAGLSTGLGFSWQMLADAALEAKVEQRWNGDRGASAGVRTRLSETGSVYVAERAATGERGPSSVAVIGAEDRFGPGGGKSYGEYQIDSSALGVRNRAVLGLGQKWRLSPALAVGLAFEHQQVVGGFLPDGTPVGDNQRHLLRGGLDLTLGPRLRAGVRAEIRLDRGLRGDGAATQLVESDPRPGAAADAFADHGGVAPGAPLILPAGEATQLVGSAGLTWRAQEGVTLFGRARGTVTLREDASGPAADDPGFGELTTGLAYRSLLDDNLDVLLRYSYVFERRPGEPEGLEPGAAQRSHILAAVPVAELPWRLRLSGKLAWKKSEATGGLAADSSSSAVLALGRLGVSLVGNWDVAVEGRSLWILQQGSRQLRVGSLVELGYWIGSFVRLGAGYNFSHFDDNELGDLTRDAHGLFVRLTAEM